MIIKELYDDVEYDRRKSFEFVADLVNLLSNTELV